MNYKKSLSLILIFLAIFALTRGWLYVEYFDYFGELSFKDTILAFIQGIRFDLNVIFTFLSPLILVQSLPFIRPYKMLDRLCFAYASVMLVIFVFALMGDVIYFREVQRHMGDEIFRLSTEILWLVKLPVLYPYHLLFGLLLIIAGIYLLYKTQIQKNAQEFAQKYRIAIFVAMLLVGFLAIRGTITSKPISISNAFTNGSQKFGTLSLNGIFTSFIYHKRMGRHNYAYYPMDEALANLGLNASEYPLEKSYNNERSNLNIVFILMESWMPQFIDSFEGKGEAVTPNFDELARNGLRFSNFFANGSRSIEGIQSALTGIVPLQGYPNLGFGLENSNITKLGNILRNNGYESIMMQTSKRGSYYMDTIANVLGFDRYFGMEDMPVMLDYPNPKGAQFGWDYEGYMKLLGEINKSKRNFFAFFFTGTTHVEFPRLQERFEKFPYDDGHGVNAFKNMLHYSDWALGEFMRLAKKEPWFEDTIFILFSDHTNGLGRDWTLRSRFRIPCVFYSPKHIAPGVHTAYSHQLQIMPTIIDLLGFKDPFYSLTHSIFKNHGDGELIYNLGGETTSLISSDGFLVKSGDSVLESSYDPARLEEQNKKLQSIITVVGELLRTNKIAR